MRRYALPEGINPFDASSYALVAVAVLAAGLLATWRPSRHALRIEPAVALRYE
jgi:ABC-type lipoprotein release transport system permease subunit